MTESDATPLSPFYYRDNYLRLCDTVEAQYGDILGDDERKLLQVFRALTFNAQCLYVRLISRTGLRLKTSWHQSGMTAVTSISTTHSGLASAVVVYWGEHGNTPFGHLPISR